MRTQLYGLQRTYTDDSDYSPTTMKRLLLLKSREKFIRKTEQNNAHIDEQPLAPLEETQVVPRSPKRRFTGDRALLERLSALSSQRNSARSSVGTTLSSKRSSKSNSAYNVLDSPVTEMIPVNNQTSAEIYNVLRKLHDSIDELETDDIDPNRTKPGLDSKPEKQHRLSDPLLPEERDIIESLLSKYSMLEGKSPVLEEPLKEKEEKITFSSKVKIRGTSPYHSRASSVIKRNLSKSTESSDSSLPKEEGLRPSLRRPSLLESITMTEQSNIGTPTQEKGPVLSLIKDHIDTAKNTATDSNQSTPKFTPRGTPRARKISTVKEFTMKFEAQNQQHRRLEEPKFTIVPEQKFYQVSSESDSSSDSSSSSEYEDTIVKTNEGFIIPDEAIEKLPINKAAKAQRLREEQEEIERQFKKENFLKDLPVRHRGIRMPTGSAGKVNLLKSKFEGKSLANAMTTEKRNASLRNTSHHTRHQQASRLLATNTNNESSNGPTSSKQPRTFFKKRRQVSRSTESDSDGTVELNPMKSRGNFDSSFDTNSCSSERDFVQAYHEKKSYFIPQTIPRDDFSDSEHSDCLSDSGKSFHSDRKRKNVPMFRFNKHEDLERWV
uniref:Uncharacterized protein n=1 Tax=Clytia hemisphaerica TaxID=252671 RepID=A0A7M5XEH8_9CNID